MPITSANEVGSTSPLRGQQPLSMHLLRGPQDRQSIAHLRRLSPSGVEDDLGLGLAPFEAVRDQIGMVLAYQRDHRVVATLRFVPSGRGMTGLERLPGKTALPPNILSPGSWEVGRVVVAPEERHNDILAQCFSIALMEILRTQVVQRFYAIATPVVARLWRRYGMQLATTVHGASGQEYKVVVGRVADVAAALGLPIDLSTTPSRVELLRQGIPLN